MSSDKKLRLLAGTTIVLLLLSVGCAPSARKAAESQVEETLITEPVSLALKFAEQDSTTYRLVTQSERTVKFVGSLPEDNTLKGGRKLDTTEMTFTRQVQSLDEKGNAIVKITIKEIKYISTVRKTTLHNVDSTRESDKNNPLVKLVGQSYTIKIAPTGQVIEVLDTAPAQAVVSGKTSAHRVASSMLSKKAIMRRHGTLILPATGQSQLNKGQTWSNVKTFSFDLMGSKSFEKIYTLKDLKVQDGRQLAIVEMEAIPAEKAEESDADKPMNSFLEMFDTTELHSGQLTFDLAAGKVEKCLEEFRTEWTIVDPSTKLEENKEPSAIKMSAWRFYNLEIIR